MARLGRLMQRSRCCQWCTRALWRTLPGSSPHRFRRAQKRLRQFLTLSLPRGLAKFPVVLNLLPIPPRTKFCIISFYFLLRLTILRFFPNGFVGFIKPLMIDHGRERGAEKSIFILIRVCKTTAHQQLPHASWLCHGFTCLFREPLLFIVQSSPGLWRHWALSTNQRCPCDAGNARGFFLSLLARAPLAAPSRPC